ncbi:MAG: 50S ribosomal protein L1 [SAR202 cluster bacterium]|nr:50S ribosomal protein L1 [SAR202 cluster bacterium]
MASKHGKRFDTASALVDREQRYQPADAVSIVKKAATSEFDETVELHLRTTADPRHADQNLRGVAVLPYGLGKPVRIAVFAQGEAARAAQEAGADVIGADDLIERVEGGFTDFDVAIATPDLMGKIGKLGRILGRKGLMPNPRTGTVVQPQDVGNAVREGKKGRVELRMDKTAIIHAAIGKASFSEQQLVDNLTAVVDTVNRLKPAAIKAQFVKSATLTSSMGPGVPMDVPGTMALRSE